MKRVTITAALVVLAGGLAALAGAPALAGSGSSTWCDNGAGGEYPILESPITLAAQKDSNAVSLCYSTTPQGAPGGVTGGIVQVNWQTDTSALHVTAQVMCLADPGVNFAPVCGTGANGASAGTVSATPGTTTYAATNGGPCLWVLGAQYLSTCSSAATASVNTADAPSASLVGTTQCLVQVGATCYAYLTGVKITSGCDANPTVSIYTAATGPRTADLPRAC